MIYCFDIDGTICETEGMDYANAKPIPWMVDAIKKLRAEGHEIKYYTARGMGDGEHASLSERQKANHQLFRVWGLPQGPIHAKPYADVYVDDRAQNASQWRILI